MITFPGNPWTSCLISRNHLEGAALKMPLMGLRMSPALQPGSSHQVQVTVVAASALVTRPVITASSLVLGSPASKRKLAD